MDPNAAYQLAEQKLEEGLFEECLEVIEDIFEWLQKGGFFPGDLLMNILSFEQECFEAIYSL